jgi:hypothetical protein
MVGGKMSMLIFILASGYLFTVYILLAIAKRSSKRTFRRQEVEGRRQEEPTFKKVGLN